MKLILVDPAVLVEKVARAVMESDHCGITVDGERVLCDHPDAPDYLHSAPGSCACRQGAIAALSVIENEMLASASLGKDQPADQASRHVVPPDEDAAYFKRSFVPRQWVTELSGLQRTGVISNKLGAGRSSYLVKFGPDGPFVEKRASDLRDATKDEVNEMLGR